MSGKTSYQSIKKYEDKAYDKILLRIPKGQRNIIKSAADTVGESINGYIKKAITERMERDNKNGQTG